MAAVIVAGSTALGAAASSAQPAQDMTSDQIIAHREDALAYAVGLQAYIYAYPALDYMRVMGEQTAPGLDPHGVYGPANTLVYQDALAEPGGFYKGRSPNNDTIYFTSWIDTTKGPVLVQAPDTQDRYYSLTFADFYSNVQHTGRRTTGTAAQSVMVVGPEWKGTPVAGAHLVRLATHQGYLLGRLLVYGRDDLPKAQALLRRFAMEGPSAIAAPGAPPPKADEMRSVRAFRHINQFLRANPRLPGEEALMAQFDSVGLGPERSFDESQISDATRRGLERAAVDGHAILLNAARAAPPRSGWSPVAANHGQFGFDYYWRAAIEANGFLINLPHEAVYPTAMTDSAGRMLNGDFSYRLVFPKDGLPPQDAFWSITPYSIPDRDLIPNPDKIYALGDRAGPLKRRADGATEILIQKERPSDRHVNWLPVSPGQFFLSVRIYQPREDVLDGRYSLPPIERIDGAAR